MKGKEKKAAKEIAMGFGMIVVYVGTIVAGCMVGQAVADKILGIKK